MSERCIAAHVQAAMAVGAAVHSQEHVIDWDVCGDQISVRTHRATYTTRRLVVTAGPWAGKVVGALGPVVTPERQVVMWLRPRRPEYFQAETFPVFYLHGEEGSFLRLPAH